MRSSILFVTVSMLSSACGALAPQPDPTRLFVLATIEELDPARRVAEHPEPSEEVRGASPRSGETLGIGPLSFPDYVLRGELVSREGATRVVPFRDARWAEPLDQAVARVLASDLALLTGTRTLTHPWFATEAPDAHVRIAFERFELEERARAVLVATWTLVDANGNVLHERQSIERALSEADGAGAALALSEALADLCAEIAAASHDRQP